MDKVPNKVEVPKDQSTAAQVASPVATLASHVDPLPDYLAAAICAGSGGALYNRGNPRAAAAAAGFSLLYFSAGRLLASGNPKLGYDLGTATSLGLLAWTVPGASVSGINTVMATVGGVSTVPNLIKSYQFRTGRPHEMHEKSMRG